MKKFITILKALAGLFFLVAAIGCFTQGDVLVGFLVLTNITLYITPVWNAMIGQDHQRVRAWWVFRILALAVLFLAIQTTESSQDPTTSSPAAQVVTPTPQAPSMPASGERIKEIVTSIRESSRVEGVKLTVNVAIKRRLSTTEIPKAIKHVLNRISESYESLFIFLYLEGNTADVGGAWAMVQVIDGKVAGTQVAFPLEDEEKWLGMPTVACDKLIGEWLEDCVGFPQRRTIFKMNGKTYISHDIPGQTLGRVQLRELRPRSYQAMDVDRMVYAIDGAGFLQIFTPSGEEFSEKQRPFKDCFKTSH